MILTSSKALSCKFPAEWEIHKSVDGGESFKPWIYLANSPSLCPDGLKNDGIPNENDVVCISDFILDEVSILLLFTAIVFIQTIGVYTFEIIYLGLTILL